jgi:rhodanese-related sulfurtransferase/uncharacterized membrane protein YedE/YeeE
MKIWAFIIVGMSCGALFAHYQLCAASAIRNLLGFRRTHKTILYLCIIVASAVFFNFFIGIGLLTETVKPFVPLTLLGGILFGIGMVIAGGSTEGILFRVGEGNVPAMVSAFGMVLGMAAFGFTIAARFKGARPPHFVGDTLLKLFGIHPLVFSIVVALLAVLAVFFMMARSPERRRTLGLVLVVATVVALNGMLLRAMFFMKQSDCRIISPLVFQEMLLSGEDLVILDVRGRALYDKGHLPNAISLDDLPKGLHDMTEYRDKSVVVVCGVGLVSKLDCIKLNRMGFKKVYSLEGGLKNWARFQEEHQAGAQSAVSGGG